MMSMDEVENRVQQRALAIIHDHEIYPHRRVIVICALNEWAVRSQENPEKAHAVVYDEDEGYKCSCTYYNFKGQCKHIKAIKLVRERGIYCPMNGDQERELI